MVQRVKNPPAVQETQETQVQSLGQEDPLQEEMTTHSSILIWEIPWTEEPGGYSPWDCKESDMTQGLNNNNACLLPGATVLLAQAIHTPKDTLSLTKEARICNGEKTISLTSGAGKIGQPLVKE